ncbi:hypothetical protein Dimus_018268 [Dionaea muscipula]
MEVTQRKKQKCVDILALIPRIKKSGLTLRSREQNSSFPPGLAGRSGNPRVDNVDISSSPQLHTPPHPTTTTPFSVSLDAAFALHILTIPRRLSTASRIYKPFPVASKISSSVLRSV